MALCEYCGREMINGVCDCDKSHNSTVNKYKKNNEDPFIIPKYKVNMTSVSGFISSVRDLSGMTENIGYDNDPFESNVPIVPNCVPAEENEIVVKQYNIAKLRTRLKFMKAEGRLMVTNKRILFRACGKSLTGNIAQQHEFDLDDVSGIEIIKDYKFSILNLFLCVLAYAAAVYLVYYAFSNVIQAGAAIIGFILGFLGVAPTFFLYKRFGLKLVSAIFGTICFMVSYIASEYFWFIKVLIFLSMLIVLIDIVIVCFVPNLVIKIKTKNASPAIQIRRRNALWAAFTGDEINGFDEVLPGDDAVLAMNEIGTLINDIQQNGDNAISRWKK